MDGGIPEEVWIGKKVNYSHLKIFGCEAFVHIPKENRTKLDDKSMRCIFWGYADGEFGYRLWDPIKNKIIRSRDVIFNELEMFKSSIGNVEVNKIVNSTDIPPLQEYRQEIQECDKQQMESEAQQEEENV